ncbi:MAG: histidine--tRNA ligase [Oscillospiraceae bacterium]|nr:histidine--tRNA ligase [Oscillospiraceae bacterium]
MKITPVKGTSDYLPSDVLIRDYLQDIILKTYQASGFERITTPILEDIENLQNSDGGDNLGLIFKILKRGEKLNKSIEDQKFDELSDTGLRYDLTLPLSRYYANNRSKLSDPFKVIQIGNAYRAEQPQRGRNREFLQCDIDTIGTSSPNSEIELIDTACKTLSNIGIHNFKVKINDRRILKDILSFIGFKDDEVGIASITIDKLDKIGLSGVENELVKKNFSDDVVNKFMEIFSIEDLTIEHVKNYCKNPLYTDTLEFIISSLSKLSHSIEYDISLVRGQGYYTGPIFEIESLDYKGSIAGGGRYDDLIGKFIGETIPAVGISIGFERIFSILKENGFQIPNERKKVAVIHDKDEIVDAINFGKELKTEFNVSIFEKPRKLGKFKERLSKQNYYAIYVLGKSTEIVNKDT